MSHGPAARRFLRRHHDGALSTISVKLQGYPFGSVSPFVLDHTAAPVILISKLAEHTLNIDADGRVSLLVQDKEANAQAAGRLTVIGDAKPLTGMNALLQARYLNYLPDAARLLALGDFSFYRIEPLILRFIGGFGAIHWIPAASFLLADDAMAQCEPEVLAHLNADHAASLRDYCQYYHRCEPRELTMIGIDADGFDVRADDALLRFDFATTVYSAQEARTALIAMSREARAQ
jgi:putative heme iron utilization protein